jgi:aminoglycoside N3'-acetyltransferase
LAERAGRSADRSRSFAHFDNGTHFPAVGEQFAEARAVKTGRVGNVDALLFSTRDLVDFAKSYFLRVLARG